MKTLNATIYILIFLFGMVPTAGYSWNDETHIAIATAAGLSKPFLAIGPDMAKMKAKYEGSNHYFDNSYSRIVTPKMVVKQISLYNNRKDKIGHLYGAIIASLRGFKKGGDKYSLYQIGFCAHYVGDLSQPFHNVVYDDFNKKSHVATDEFFGNNTQVNIEEITNHMYTIRLEPSNLENDLAKEIARIANMSRELALVMKEEQRGITLEEAYIQLGHSASLMKAILSVIKLKSE